MRLLTAYTPPTFLRQSLMISTSVHYSDEGETNGINETAYIFVDALNNEDALDEYKNLHDKWKMLKKHKSKKAAIKFHVRLARKLCRGYDKHFEVYLALEQKYKQSVGLVEGRKT